jgi:7-dehydrocholesterol reductase
MPSGSSGLETRWAGKSPSRTVELLRTVVAPLLLMVTTPPVAIVLWITSTFLDGELSRLLTPSGWRLVAERWPWPSFTAAGMIAAHVLLQLLLLRLLPGPAHSGPVTPMGNQPRYRLNGVPAYLITHGLFVFCSYRLGWFRAAAPWDHFGELLATLVLFALLLCALLYVKGATRPSTTDASRSGSPVWDFFWGVELHPRLLGVELKQLVNCRVSMTGWSLLVVAFAAKQVELYGALSTSMLVAAALPLLYLFKFFVWEGGYFGSLDIMHDRFGYYICWGVLSWVPAVYAIAAQYLVLRPIALSVFVASAFFALGLLSLYVNYAADAQRLRVRSTGGKTKIWGRTPELIRATYETGDGQTRESLLLVSGYWRIARHFHYVPEIALAVAWTLPAGLDHLLPWVYVLFLTVLLLHRAGRDDRRCHAKYGRHWDEYCSRVRWRVLPGIY